MEGKLGAPRRLAALSTQYETGKAELDAIMTKGYLYNDKDRMKFITKIADKCHKLYDCRPEINRGSNWHHSHLAGSCVG